MTKIKIGDEVIITSLLEGCDESFVIGDKFTVIAIDYEDDEIDTWYHRSYECGDFCYESEVELVEDRFIYPESPEDVISEPKKYNAGKPMISLVRPEFIEGIAEVLTQGAVKYEEKRGEIPNYLQGEGFNYTEIYDSLQRHLNTWYKGIDLDNESGKNHLLHAAANIMFLYQYSISTKGKDDRLRLDDKEKLTEKGMDDRIVLARSNEKENTSERVEIGGSGEIKGEN